MISRAKLTSEVSSNTRLRHLPDSIDETFTQWRHLRFAPATAAPVNLYQVSAQQWQQVWPLDADLAGRMSDEDQRRDLVWRQHREIRRASGRRTAHRCSVARRLSLPIEVIVNVIESPGRSTFDFMIDFHQCPPGRFSGERASNA
jgi:hypothetical protein